MQQVELALKESLEPKSWGNGSRVRASQGSFEGQRAFDAVTRVRSRQRILKPATRSASLKQTVPPDWTARAVTKVLLEQTLIVSFLCSAERAFLADAASLAALLVAAVLPAGAVSLALLVVAGMPVSILLFDEPPAGLPGPMRVALRPGAAVRG